VRRPGWRAIVNGREGVEGFVEFEKPVVKVTVEVADERACSSVEGWTVDEYWPGRSTYDVPDELNTAPTVDKSLVTNQSKSCKIATHVV